MIFVKISGGLGNQMFQYAYGRSLSDRQGVDLVLDCGFYENERKHPLTTRRTFELDIFNIKAKILKETDMKSRFLMVTNVMLKKIADIAGLKRLSRSIYQIEGGVNDPSRSASWNCILHGYWQSENYFRGSAHLIRNDFQFKKELEGNNLELAERMHKTNSVSIHIRRGDYVSDEATNKTHGTCSLEYYENAVKLIADRVPNPIFYIFSDDMKWVKSNLQLTFPHEYIEGNNEQAGYIDMQLMSNCKHNIIANSSFSWWGAWLNENPDKLVIAPRQWFLNTELNAQTTDLISQKWMRI